MIVITHNHQDGTTLDGSIKGDGVFEILRDRGWSYGKWLGIHIRGSRDKFMRPSALEKHAEALREAGHEVTVEVDNTWRTAAVRWADRERRAEVRTDRLADRADRTTAKADALRESADAEIAGRPPGQPLLVGHHSYGREVRRQERHDRKLFASLETSDYAASLASRARGVVANEIAKHGSRAMARKIEALEADVRKMLRGLEEVKAGEWADLARMRVERDQEEIAFLRAILNERAETGQFVAWGPQHFRKEDWVLVRGYWLRVRRVNRKSVSVPGPYGYGQAPDSPTANETIPWDEVFGRRRDGMQLDHPDGDEYPIPPGGVS